MRGVYFALVHTKPVRLKIGSSNAVESRLRQLRTRYKADVTLIGVAQCGDRYADERTVHDLFAPWRIPGTADHAELYEWDEYSQARAESYIRKHQTAQPIQEAPTPRRTLYGIRVPEWMDEEGRKD